MKKFYLLATAIIVVCASVVTGYTVCDNATITFQEILMKKNPEALTSCEITVPGASGVGICVGTDGECEVWLTSYDENDNIIGRDLIATCSGRPN